VTAKEKRDASESGGGVKKKGLAAAAERGGDEAAAQARAAWHFRKTARGSKLRHPVGGGGSAQRLWVYFRVLGPAGFGEQFE
jgi:hypothetical protein